MRIVNRKKASRDLNKYSIENKNTNSSTNSPHSLKYKTTIREEKTSTLSQPTTARIELGLVDISHNLPGPLTPKQIAYITNILREEEILTNEMEEDLM